MALKLAALRPYAARLTGNPVFGRMGVGVASGGLLRLGPFLTMLVCARVLGAEQFGLLATIYVFVMLVTNFFGNGLQVFTLQLIADTSASGGSKDAAAAASVKVGLLFALAMAILALAAPGLVARYLLGTSAVADLVPLAALWIFTALANAILSGSFIAMQDDRALFSNGVLSAVVPLLLVPIAAMEWGVRGAVIAQGCAGVVPVAVAGWMLFRGAAASQQRISISVKSVLKRLIPMATATLFWTGSILHAMTLVAAARGGFAAVGYFAIGQQLFSAATFVPARAAVGVAPLLYEASAAGDLKRLQKVLRTAVITSVACGAGAALIVAICSLFPAELFGPDYAPASPHIGIMALAVLASSPVFVMAQYMLARGLVVLWSVVEIIGGLSLLIFVLLTAGEDSPILATGFLIGLLVKLVLDVTAVALDGSGKLRLPGRRRVERPEDPQ